MTAVVPRMFTDLADWFDFDLPTPSQLIRVEDSVKDKQYVVRAELPGLEPDKDIQVSAVDGVLTIRAERKQSDVRKHRTEFRYGMMQRSLRLPAGADAEHTGATYRDGILQVTVPLNEPDESIKRIPITT